MEEEEEEEMMGGGGGGGTSCKGLGSQGIWPRDGSEVPWADPFSQFSALQSSVGAFCIRVHSIAGRSLSSFLYRPIKFDVQIRPLHQIQPRVWSSSTPVMEHELITASSAPLSSWLILAALLAVFFVGEWTGGPSSEELGKKQRATWL
ncbi:hypothetical protein AXG93_2415s1490 [Marchantia polymorpha subsp. ruderalis]|uniref:Uncharacterized protein n=1 Tax=Marchantia polymorpha subsp. ruderalis TaxID=1480154 RepID=A0A176VUY0_MARPO|nr:hypothetical protein AXG93_2415s1490 [Marchantia polymorpha subsp. ruderalis]